MSLANGSLCSHAKQRSNSSKPFVIPKPLFLTDYPEIRPTVMVSAKMTTHKGVVVLGWRNR